MKKMKDRKSVTEKEESIENSLSAIISLLDANLNG